MSRTITRILIANRGEIACRIARTAHAMGIETVAVYSAADAQAPHVRATTEAVALPISDHGSPYLNAAALIEAARQTGADAIHPGYGFLSENAEFADAVLAAGLIFIGPPAAAMRAMGLKDAAKQAMQKAGVPVTPGYEGADQSLKSLQKAADAIGYPLLIKAVAGGGGKGMRLVEAAIEFPAALESAQREAQRAFNNPMVLLEKYIRRARHIEVQIFGDSHGQAVHLFERDCSLQRRHQKVIEEAPAPGLQAATRAALGEAAVKAAKAIGYVGAGTVEFIFDTEETNAQGLPHFYFMEMNTRLQVEHPVTEMITGLDLVEWQIRVARGEALPLAQEQIKIHGHAMEARLYAEDADQDFLPQAGRISHLHFPLQNAHVRIDSGVESGSVISIDYDPMIAKIITHAPTREQAIDRLVSALEDTQVEGLISNRAFLARLAAHPQFRKGDVETGFIAHHSADLQPRTSWDDQVVALAALGVVRAAHAGAAGPFAIAHGWQMNRAARTWVDFYPHDAAALRLSVEETSEGYSISGLSAPCTAQVRWRDATHVQADINGTPVQAVVLLGAQQVDVRIGGFNYLLALQSAAEDEAAAGGDARITAPMPGRILALDVKAGDKVEAGQRLLVLEAMKMEHPLVARAAGVVAGVYVAQGEQVGEGTLLVEMEGEG